MTERRGTAGKIGFKHNIDDREKGYGWQKGITHMIDDREKGWYGWQNRDHT